MGDKDYVESELEKLRHQSAAEAAKRRLRQDTPDKIRQYVERMRETVAARSGGNERPAVKGTHSSGINETKQAEIHQKLETLAVPMKEVPYSRAAYNKLFPRGLVKTPLKTVRMGIDQFAKLGRKDGGNRQSYIGAAYQTLTDPVVVIREGGDDVYIKSFTGEKGIKTFISVVKDKEDGRWVVTNYRRHKKEVLKKIKNADGILYWKENSSISKWTGSEVSNIGGSPSSMDKGGVRQAEDFHTPSLSSSFAERSRAIRQRQEKLELSLDALWRTTERQECILRRLVIDTRQREWKKLLFSD